MTALVTIKDIQTILTQPAGARFVVVKVITSEPGLYGLGCATFTQRFHAVHAAIDKHLRPLLIGRDVARIEEIWRLAMVHGYWRNGPVLNNAISGVDMALWDIKGKQAGLPVFQLLGGKCRGAAAVYGHADGRDVHQVEDNVRCFLGQGYRYIRVQLGGYGGEARKLSKPTGAEEGAYFDPREYMRGTLHAHQPDGRHNACPQRGHIR
jgi:mannonate dehydratase